MAKLLFYPVGNGDSTLIHLADDRLLLVDFNNWSADAADDGRVSLDEELRGYLANQNRDCLDVVAFSHADVDHVQGAEDFFWLECAPEYQDDDRVRIDELIVPASLVLETGLEGSAKAIHDEAQHRLRCGTGIRVCGEPERLETWLDREGIDPSSRTDLITRAGQCLPGFDRYHGQVEIFVHSPFSFQMEDEDAPRNANCIVWHLTLYEDGRELRCMLGADADHQNWADILYITMKNGNEDRLYWDLFRTSHHCSYLALSAEKGEEETVPREEVAGLFELGTDNCLLIASSHAIPTEDTDQPPHRQAAAFYRKTAREKGDGDNFVVTMEWPPKSDKRSPVIVETSPFGFELVKTLATVGGPETVLHRPSTRVG